MFMVSIKLWLERYLNHKGPGAMRGRWVAVAVAGVRVRDAANKIESNSRYVALTLDPIDGASPSAGSRSRSTSARQLKRAQGTDGLAR